MTLFPSFLLVPHAPTALLPQALLLQTSAPSAFLQFAPIVVIFGIFYLLLFLPMQKQKKAQAKLLSELKNGDVVVTTGGIIGTITTVDADTLTLRIKPDNLKLQFARSAVSSLVTAEGSK